MILIIFLTLDTWLGYRNPVTMVALKTTNVSTFLCLCHLYPYSVSPVHHTATHYPALYRELSGNQLVNSSLKFYKYPGQKQPHKDNTTVFDEPWKMVKLLIISKSSFALAARMFEK